jgi:hypothetical protein
MIIAIGLTAIALIGWNNDVEADFISRVENTELLDSAGHSIPRVQRNADGNVDKLHLNGMQLSAEDFAAIGRLKTLRFLTLYRTNVTNADLRLLCELPLEGLNLTSTEVSDAAIDEILKLESLRSLCLGNVAITRDAVDRLKEDFFRAHEKRLSLGYSQRR